MEGSFNFVQIAAVLISLFAVSCFIGLAFGTVYWAIQRYRRKLMENLSRRQPMEE